ncbi:MAG: hypothetical protein PHS17_10405, partial [Desulfobacterales bacterium]|nr:hypothetical protein [Desulfobacterales bacterium]
QMKMMRIFAFWIVLMAFFLVVAFALPELTFSSEEIDKESKYGEVEKKWGIKPLMVRLTGAEHFLDFRYVVVDAAKAKSIMHGKKKALLKDQESGETFVAMTKMGAMRGKTTDPKPGKEYFILFTNADKSIKRGQKVTVIIHDCTVEGLKVE